MKLLDIPTDNLYKFMAISGVLVFLSSFIPYIHFHNLNLSSIKLESEIILLVKEAEWLESDTKQLRDEVSELKLQTYELEKTIAKNRNGQDKLSTKIKSELDDIKIKMNEINLKNLELMEKQREIERKNIEHKTKNQEHRYLSRLIKIEKTIASLIAILGLGLSIYGFSLWYKKLQHPQDVLMSKRLESDANRTERDNSTEIQNGN